jgi:hypothetical protein
MSLPILLWIAACELTQLSTSPALVEIGRVKHEGFSEASGLESSRRFPGVYWAVCDSGNPPHLYALDARGQMLAEYRIDEAVNLDWECLAIDHLGNLYICDVGNNVLQGKSRLPQRWTYVVREPDPRSSPQSSEPRLLPIDRTLLVRYPEGPFDIEAAFAWGDDLYFVSKLGRDTAVFRLPCSQPADEDDSEPTYTLERVVGLPDVSSVTSAAISSGGDHLAICTYHEACLFQVRPGAVFELASNRPYRRVPFRASEVEACTWDRRNLLLLSELGIFYRLKLE